MAKQYYYFIAGLPSISMDDSKLVYNPVQFRDEAKAQLSEEDFKLIQVLHLPEDIANLLKTIYKKEQALNPEGLYSKEFWEEFIAFVKHSLDSINLETPSEYRSLPPFVKETAAELLQMEDLPTFPLAEHRILSRLFSYCAHHSNRFIREWFELECNIRNILAAINGRNHELDFAKYLIGEDDIVKNLTHSHAADFGMGKEHPLFDSLQRIWEQNNILYRERGYDVLRSKWIDDQNFFDFFNVDRLLGYYSKLRIINRWLKADAELGKEVFHDTLNKLENSFEYPEDFNIKK
ncbi:MAG: DUF2764 family protein [Candidatus Cloacimonetes bacterium]|nr:DUF2764 family protein [Candidatus Cloacimonadota bacterium]